LSTAEVWTLIHGFYPWPDSLAPFASTCPADLGQALETLLATHAGDPALQESAVAAGLAEQRRHAHRTRSRKALSDQLERGLWRAWYGLREAIAPPKPRSS
jgi:transposase